MKKKSTIYNPPIAMAEEYWRNSHFSVARFYGGANINGQEYIICDKHGRDVFELSAIAKKEGRAMAIEPGEPADLVISDWLSLYRKVGRERFMQIVECTNDLAEAERMAEENTGKQ